jgi:hypothetical protein
MDAVIRRQERIENLKKARLALLDKIRALKSDADKDALRTVMSELNELMRLKSLYKRNNT